MFCKESNFYSLLDSGNGRKLERFASYLIDRPCSQAVWKPMLSGAEWEKADAFFIRGKENFWKKKLLPEGWNMEMESILMRLFPTDFGHLGIFPEHVEMWKWVRQVLSEEKRKKGRECSVLNLFAYSGGMTLAAALEGASVCHVDASRGMVDWAKENALLNRLEGAPIRWIVDDVMKFISREAKRGNRYDAIILDPPSFGRGKRGEIFKIEEDLSHLLKKCRLLLSESPLFVLFSCHTPGYTPLVMRRLLEQTMQGKKGRMEEGEMLLSGDREAFSIPSGSYCRWRYDYRV